jgi:hypothetical protein
LRLEPLFLHGVNVVLILDEDGFMFTSTSVSDSESIVSPVFERIKFGPALVSLESYNTFYSVSSNQLYTFYIFSAIMM